MFADHGKKFAMGLEVVLARISWLGAFRGNPSSVADWDSRNTFLPHRRGCPGRGTFDGKTAFNRSGLFSPVDAVPDGDDLGCGIADGVPIAG